MEYWLDHPLPLAAAAASLLAALAWWGDRRRSRRRDLDRVGLMPWTTVFFWSLLAAVLLGAVSLKG